MGKQQEKFAKDSHKQTIHIQPHQQLMNNANSNETTNNQSQIKKKIIKKFPFNFKTTLSNKKSQDKGIDNCNDDGLSDWRPVGLQSNKKQALNEQSKDKLSSKSKNIASQFLSFLSKPKQSLLTNDQLNTLDRQQQWNKLLKKRLQIKKQMILVEKQQHEGQSNKWDCEDQFLRKSIHEEVPEEKQLAVQGRLQQQIGDDDVVERIQWLNQKDKKKKFNKNQLTISQLVAKSWQKQQKQLNLALKDLSSSSNDEDDPIVATTKKKILKKNIKTNLNL